MDSQDSEGFATVLRGGARGWWLVVRDSGGVWRVGRGEGLVARGERHGAGRCEAGWGGGAWGRSELRGVGGERRRRERRGIGAAAGGGGP